jgi:hypothetical protein
VGNLEVVTMKMERMFSGIMVVNDNFDNFVMRKNKGVSIDAIHRWICSERACGEGGIEGRDKWPNIGCRIEESVVDAVS